MRVAGFVFERWNALRGGRPAKNRGERWEALERGDWGEVLERGDWGEVLERLGGLEDFDIEERDGGWAKAELGMCAVFGSSNTEGVEGIGDVGVVVGAKFAVG